MRDVSEVTNTHGYSINLKGWRS